MTTSGGRRSLFVSVIIVTRDRARELEACLRSVVPQLDGEDEVVIIAGNESSCPAEMVESLSQATRVQVGFCPEPNICKARNMGLDLATNPLVLFIDDDAIAHDGWVDAYADSFAAQPKACIGGGIALDAREESRPPEFAFGLIHPSGRQIEVRASENAPIPPGYTKSVKGCNFGILRDRMPVPERFDTFFRFAFDEADLVMAVHAAGGLVVHVPGAVVDHLHAPGLYRSDCPLDRDWRTEFASHTNFMLKHTRGVVRIQGWCVVMGRFVKHAFRALYAQIGRSGQGRSGAHAILEAYGGIRSAMRSNGNV
jgi:glycosyltransferase involved in cell wall biosynthesis